MRTSVLDQRSRNVYSLEVRTCKVTKANQITRHRTLTNTAVTELKPKFASPQTLTKVRTSQTKPIVW